jgi:hypothetical protein
MSIFAEARTPGRLDGDAESLHERIAGWVPAIAILLVFSVLGPFLGSPGRALFVLACAALGWRAWRQSPSAHVRAVLLLFVFAPFVRRLVDLRAGYDTSGLMLLGPLAALAAPILGLADVVVSHRRARGMGPLFIVAGCIAYATALTLFAGEWLAAARDTLKWGAPLLYAVALADRADRDEIIAAMTDVLGVALPIAGAYGVLQYVDPPAWDRYWMQFAPITSIGLPAPYSLRSFATMAAPAGFATFTAAGLLLVWIRRSDLLSLVATAPAALALFLSSYRTAWISLVVGIAFCGLFPATRRRSLAMILGGAVAVTAVLTLTPFGETISQRLASFSEGSRDGSAKERIEEYAALWERPDSSLVGSGFSTVDVGSAGAQPVDGMIVSCWHSMGIVVGLVCLFALFWAIGGAIVAARRDTRQEGVLVGAFGVFFLAQLPLASITSGEAGLLFWVFMALGLAPPAPEWRRR